MLLVLDVLLIVSYYLLLRVFSVYLSYSMYVTMSISIGLYPNLDLWISNKHYITLITLPPVGFQDALAIAFYTTHLFLLHDMIMFISNHLAPCW
jgi:hypothetical protein